MKYAIEILKERAHKLQVAYIDHVENGTVDPNSKIALENRAKLKSCEDAIRKINTNDEALKLLRDLADHQNGAPLLRHEKEYNETMHEVWDFLEANETE